MYRTYTKWLGHDLFIPGLFAFVAFVLLIVTAPNYGIFTDEFYFIACAKHLDLGYVDHPPFVAWITWLNLLFGNSLVVLRIFPALAYSATLLTVSKIARVLGGSVFASAISSLALMSGMVFWIMFGYVSMNAYDIFFITLASYFFIRSLNTSSARNWLILGIIVGIGVNTKMTMVIFAASMVVALLLTSQRRWFKTWFPYATIGVACLMALPYCMWQISNGFPTLEFIRNASDKNLGLPVLSILGQLILSTNPFVFPLWISGLYWLIGSKQLRSILPLPLSVVVFFCVYLLNRSKFYYMLPVIPLLVAAGSVAFEHWTSDRLRWLRHAAIVVLFSTGVLILPIGLPIIPIGSFASFVHKLDFTNTFQTERNESQIIPGYFGQRFGWQEFAQTVAKVYYALPDSDRVKCGILGFHYGESGAIDYYGPALGLPNAIGRHNSYWLWGTRGYTGEVLIVAISGKARPEVYFEDITLCATYELPYVDGPFRIHRIYVCRKPLEPFATLWNTMRTYD